MLVKKLVFIVTLWLSVCWVTAFPAPEKRDKHADANLLYDQRQEGGLNVRAQLDNFLIMIIPAQSAAEAGSLSLLDFLTKSLPKGSHLKRIKHVKNQQTPDPLPEAPELETQHFIESKTAPYHVDLTKPSVDMKPSTDADDVILANSPSIKVVNTDGTSNDKQRRSRHYVLTIPTDEEYILSKNIEPKSVVRKHKKTIKEKTKSELKLLGSENEQCGPGMVRNSYGVCTFLKHSK